MSRTVTAPAASMSLPVLYTLRFVLPLRHWDVRTTTVPFSFAFRIRGIMSSLTWPRPEPAMTTPLDLMKTSSNTAGFMPGKYCKRTQDCSIAVLTSMGASGASEPHEHSILPSASICATGGALMLLKASRREVCIFLTLVPRCTAKESSPKVSCITTYTPARFARVQNLAQAMRLLDASEDGRSEDL